MIQVKKLYKCQKAIRICKERNTTDVHFSAIKDDVLAAACDLNECEFKVYMYLITNQEGYIFGLSKADICARTGISERSYTSAIRILVERGYLTYTKEFATDGKETAPLYVFHSKPDAKFA